VELCRASGLCPAVGTDLSRVGSVAGELW
jgi:hypothetical protein